MTLIFLFYLFAGCQRHNDAPPSASSQQFAFDGTIVAVGDSLTAGLGVNEEDAYPAQLEAKLMSAGYKWRVINAGISGETSRGTLARVFWLMKLKPDIIILETGANDGLRGIDTRETRKNIDETVRILQANNVVVVLAGMKMVTNLGQKFTKEFYSNYLMIAEKYNLILVPFFLEGVAGDPSLNQTDGIHPTLEGYRIIAKTIYPYVIKAIDMRKR